MVTPFCPSTVWTGYFLEASERGADYEAACREANGRAGVIGKGFARCRIASGAMTVPVEGGSGRLKHRDADPRLSDHGKWRREHLGAWNAAYGRSPYFIHLMPEIEKIYRESEGIRLEDFGRRMLELALSRIDRKALCKCDPELRDTLRAEKGAGTDRELSIFDLLFRLDREAVFVV